jgi:hypothetical protein
VLPYDGVVAPPPHWNTIGVRQGLRRLTGPARLVALFRWQRGDALLGASFFDTANDDRELVDPVSVTWSDFPEREAMDALNAPSAS